MRSSLVRAAICVVPVLIVGQAATAQIIHPLEGLDPSGFNTNNPGSWFRGYEFTVAGDGVTAVEIGMRTPASGEAVTLQIWDVNSQTLLTSASARTHGNSWQYYDVPDVALANGGTYVVGILAQNNSANYFFASGLGSEWYPTGVINYNTMRFNGGDGSFPTLTLDGYHYGVVDLGYTIPAPASAAVLAMGGIAAVRRRRA